VTVAAPVATAATTTTAAENGAVRDADVEWLSIGRLTP